MNLKTKTISLTCLCFIVILAGSYGALNIISQDIRTGIASMYAKEQVRYNRTRLLQPLLRELALARKLADSTIIRAWASDEKNPSLQAAALQELEDYRRFFADQSYFFALRQSGHYYFNDRNNSYLGQELRYTLNPESAEDLWFYRTLENEQGYALNVDFDEKLQVTKVWLNVVVQQAGQPLGVIGTGIDLSDFIASVVASEQPGVTSIFIEKSGAIQAHNNPSFIDFRTISKLESERKTIFQLIDSEEDAKNLSDVIRRLHSGENDVEITTAHIAGTEYLIGVTAINEIGWFNITLLETASVIGPQHFIPFALLLLVALSLFSTALVLLLNRFVFGRIYRLDNLVQKFSRDTATLFPANGIQDELGHLEQSFQKLTVSVQEQAKDLEDKVAERTRELLEKNTQLLKAQTEVKTLSGLLPICMYCKEIRNDQGAWTQLEQYIAEHSEAEFSHGICDKCMAVNFPQK